jgi:hypothetical protein
MAAPTVGRDTLAALRALHRILGREHVRVIDVRANPPERNTVREVDQRRSRSA